MLEIAKVNRRNYEMFSVGNGKRECSYIQCSSEAAQQRPKANKCHYRLMAMPIICIFVVFPAIFGSSYSEVLLWSFNLLHGIAFAVRMFLFLVDGYLYKRKEYREYKYVEDGRNWPIYTVLLSLYKEKYSVISTLLSSIKNISYPVEKIDLKVLMHEGDGETIEAVNSLKNMCNFEIIEIPRGDVRSKPNTCNFGLEKAKGKYLTIYDAEDVPDKFQLKKAIWKFESLLENYASLQAAVNYYNARENFLIRCFSVEYSMWSDFTLKAIRKFILFSTRLEQ
jgi:hypothetical protein